MYWCTQHKVALKQQVFAPASKSASWFYDARKHEPTPSEFPDGKRGSLARFWYASWREVAVPRTRQR
jgi:hypothetical protein